MLNQGNRWIIGDIPGTHLEISGAGSTGVRISLADLNTLKLQGRWPTKVARTPKACSAVHQNRFATLVAGSRGCLIFPPPPPPTDALENRPSISVHGAPAYGTKELPSRTDFFVASYAEASLLII
ncbi:hypothetical protein KM043_014816 [Ampulex compressa]|nr:hypothetical protein KM043_014816 [Ampulex compressa]